MSFIIDPSSASFSASLADIDAFIGAAPDSAKWRDFFASSTGTIVRQLMAGVSTFLGYNVITARRESSIRYAENRSSVVAEAQSFGYSSYRGNNPVLTLTVVPNLTTVWPKWTVVGRVKDQNLILAADTVVNLGVPVAIDVIVGNISSDVLTVQNADPTVFRFRAPGFSEDVRVYLNAVEVETSERMLDLVNEKFVVQSNVFGAVDVLYLNLDTFATRFQTADEVSVSWIALNNTQFALADLTFLFGALVAASVTSVYTGPESKASIQINGPLFNETQFIIRGREDYKKTFKLTNTSIVSTEGRDVSAAVVELFYVRSDNSLFSAAEKAVILAKLSASRPFGVAPAIISDPTINFLSLLITPQITGTGAVQSDVDLIVQEYANLLKGLVDFTTLENRIEKLSYVKTARVTYNPTVWAANRLYRRGNYVTPTSPSLAESAFVYEATSKAYRSGPTEPAWDSVLGGTNVDQVEDTSAGVRAKGTYSGIRFLSSNPGLAGNFAALSFDGVKTAGKVVAEWNGANPGNPVQMDLSDLINNLDLTVPPLGSLTLAGGVEGAGNSAGVQGAGSGLLWSTVALSGSPVAWQAGTPYAVGDVVAPTSGAITGNPALATRMFVVAETINRAGKDLTVKTAVQALGPNTFTAKNPGANGNNIVLVFDGIATVTQVTFAWNTGNASNQVAFTGSGATVPAAGTVTLAGGAGAQAKASYNAVNFAANAYGKSGNQVALTFDGTSSVAQVVAAWNNKNKATTGTSFGPNITNPPNVGQNETILVSYSPESAGTDVLVAGVVAMVGGISAVTREPDWPASPALC